MTKKAAQILMVLLLPAMVFAPSLSCALDPPVSTFQMNMTNYMVGPTRVATDTAGNIYVADATLRSVTVLDPLGNQLFIIGGSDTPKSVAVDMQKRIYVGYWGDGQPAYVAVYDAAGQFLRYLGAGPGEFASPVDIAISYTTGRIYVTDREQHAVRVFDGNGDYLFHFGGFGEYDYQYSETVNQGKFNYPSGITVDDIRQEVLVSDERNYRIQIFDFDGNYKAFFGKYTKEKVFGSLLPSDFQGKFSSISGLTVDREGRIYVADTFQCNVQVLDRDGNFLTFISTYGLGDGQLNSPLDVTIDNQKRLIITDRNNNRLSVFRIDSGPAINNMAPEPPVQVSPANAVQVGGSLTPSLTVYNANDPNGDLLNYRFEIDTSSSFTSPMAVVAASGSTYTSATTSVLTDHTVYFWRVRAEEAATVDMFTSGWSGTRTFYLNAVNRPPSAPSTLMPAAGSTVNKSTSLSWGVSTDPDLYDTLTYVVEVSDKANFSTIVLSEAGLGSNSIRISNMAQYTLLKSGITYYWRVRAIDNHGASSAYSSSGSFVFQKTLIEVTSDPVGARVYIDGNYAYLGTYAGVTSSTPLEIADIQPGRHVVRVEKEGYYSYYTSVLLTLGETEEVYADMVAKASGTLPFTRQLTDENGAVIGDGLPSLASVKPFLVDWNNDGAKDMLVGDDAGRVYLFENVSTDSAPVYRISGDYTEGVVLAVAGKAAPFAVDWNNDGRKDLLVGSNDGTVRLYLNLGSEELPDFDVFFDLAANGSAIQVSGNATPFVADWNNDGKKDLLVGESSGMARLYLNSGSDDLPVFDDTGQIVQGARIQAGGVDVTVAADAVPFVADWNNDGKKDILVGGGAGLWVFLNSGTDAAPVLDASEAAYLSGTGLAPFVLDYNDDGYIDLLVGNSDGNLSYYQFKRDAPPPGAPTVKEKKKDKGVKKLWKKFKFW